MAALGTPPPDSLADALHIAKMILSRDDRLRIEGRVDAEAERLVTAAFRRSTGVNLSRMDLFSRLRDRFPEDAGLWLMIQAGARAEGKLLQYLIGYQSFLDHEYEVSSEVLVPRPETEILIRVAIDQLASARRGAPRLGLEIGLGSGILSIELLARFPGLEMQASELSAGAIQVARKNAEKILGTGAGRLKIQAAAGALDVWQPLAGVPPADFVISNPPYLSINEEEVTPEVLLHEPHSALFAPPEDLLWFYRKIAAEGAAHLVPGGWIFLEVAHSRASEVAALFVGESWQTRIYPDLTGRDRVLAIQSNPQKEPTHG